MTPPPRTDFAARLLELRERHDPPLSQREAAALIGLSLRQYGRLERGQADATLATVRKIADAYDIAPRALAGIDPEPSAVGAGPAPSADDLARLERKVELLLAHFGLAAGNGEPLPAREEREPAARRPVAGSPL